MKPILQLERKPTVAFPPPHNLPNEMPHESRIVIGQERFENQGHSFSQLSPAPLLILC